MRHQSRLAELLRLAEDHTRSRRLRRAIHAYRRILQLAPPGDHRHELAQIRLADLHSALDEDRCAIPHLLRAQALAAQPEAEYALMLGEAYARAAAPQRAAAALHEAVPCPVHGGLALRRLAGLLAEAGDRAGARRLAAHAAARGDDPQADRALARALADA